MNALDALLAPYKAALAGEEMNTNDPIYQLLNPPATPKERTGGPLDSLVAGPGGKTKAQLRAGFLAAGRPDLARMVGTDDFEDWIGQESGWRPGAVSPANNQGLRNGGLFQFWYGHDFSNPYEGRNKFKASPYEQAIMAANNFDLDPGDIRRYAQQIRSGTYSGWG